MVMKKTLKRNPSDDSKYTYRVLKERERSRNSGDELARDIIKIYKQHPELSDKIMNKLEKAIERYSESENWYPGWEFLEHVRDSRS